MPAIQTAKMTAEQFLQLGEDPPGIRLELVDGEIELTPSPMPQHSKADRTLTLLLLQHIREHDLGELFGDVDTIFGDHDIRRPDLIFFRTERLHLVGPTAMQGPPDLCVEIVSPSSVETDRVRKFEQYEAGGVAHYWIVDPGDRTIEAWQRVNGRYQPAGRGRGDQVVSLPPFDDFALPLGELWWPPRRS